MPNRKLHKFIIITIIVPLEHDSVIRRENDSYQSPLIAGSQTERLLPQVPAKKKGLLLLTASAQGQQTTAGEESLNLAVSVALDGVEIAYDFASFYHFSDRPALKAFASTSYVLDDQPNHKLKVTAGGNKITVNSVSLRYQILELPT
jgi:hypothetical protein